MSLETKNYDSCCSGVDAEVNAPKLSEFTIWLETSDSIRFISSTPCEATSSQAAIL